jgi:hypothetical protein
LDERSHPYELFYQIWKLSYLFGRLYADVSISFEELVARPEPTLRKLFTDLSISDYDLKKLVALISPVPLGKWRGYAADEWFTAIEARVEQAFEDYASPAVMVRSVGGAAPRHSRRCSSSVTADHRDERR